MKKLLKIISLLIILAAMLQFTQQTKKVSYEQHFFSSINIKKLIKSHDEYTFKIYVDIEKRKLYVFQKIKWHNKSPKNINELYLSFPINAFSNNNSGLSPNTILENENKTTYQIKKILVNNQNHKIHFIKSKATNYIDSTIAKLKLKNYLNNNDTLIISISYSIKIPKSISNFGYAPGENFLVFDNFFPFIFPINDSIQVINRMHSFSKPFKDLANYSAMVTFPSDYKIISNANVEKEIINGINKSVSLKMIESFDFTFLLCRDIFNKSFDFVSQSNSKTRIIINLRNSRENYFLRIKKAVVNSLNFLSKKIGKVPFDKIEVVDVSPSSNSQNVSLPGMIRISIDLFSPKSLGKIEQNIYYLMAQQYFGCSVVVNEYYDKMITNGIAAYLSDKIYKEYNQNPYVYFHFVHYYPVYGLNIFSYNEIPIIYTVTAIQYPVEFRNMDLYYQNPSFISITDSNYKINSFLESKVVNEIKPKLLLMTIENIIEKKFLLTKLKSIYNKNKSSAINRQKFYEMISSLSTNNDFIKDIFYKDEIIDNKVIYLRKISSTKYELRIEKSHVINMPLEIEIKTADGIIKKTWHNSNKVETIIFASKSECLSAEIDPRRKFISDINFANNSYVVSEKYWGSISIAVRAYFWFQNALLIMSSVG